MSGLHQTWTDPSYPICNGCDEEADANGWCCNCCCHVSDWKDLPMAKVETSIAKMSFGEPLDELKRTGTGEWL